MIPITCNRLNKFFALIANWIYLWGNFSSLEASNSFGMGLEECFLVCEIGLSGFFPLSVVLGGLG